MIDRFLTRSFFRLVWLLFIIVVCGGALGFAQVRYIEKEDVSFIDTPTKDFDSANAECRARVVADYVPAEHLVLGGVRYSLEYTQLLTIVTSHINLNKALYASTASGGSTTVSFLMSGTDSLLANTWRWVGGRYNATVFYTTQNLCVLGFYCNWQAGQPPPFTWQHCMAMEGPRPPNVNTDVVWTASSARWHVVPCNDTRIPAMCRAYRCVLTLDCMPVNTASVSGYFPNCKCKCRSGFKGKDCRFAVTATLPLTLTQEQSANTRSRSMTATVTTTTSVSTSLSEITHASTNTKSAAQTNTAPLTSTAERTKTKPVPPTRTTTVSRTIVQTTSDELSRSLTGLTTVTAARTVSRTATKTLFFVTPSMSTTRTHVLTETGLVTNTQTKKLTLTKIKTESTSATRSLVPINTRTSTESRSQIATRTRERPATETISTTVSSYESVSITKLATLTSPGKRTVSRSVTAVGPATSTISATLFITKTLSVPLSDTKTRIPPPTPTKSRTLQNTDSSTLTRSKDLPLTPSAYTLSEVITITKTKVFTETATRSASRTLTRTKLPPNTPTIPDPVTVTQSKTLAITASPDPERTETPQFLTIDRTLTRTLALSRSGSHSLTVTRSISGTTSSSKSWSTTMTVTHTTTPSHTILPPPTQTLDVPTRTMTSTFEETISSSLTLTQTIEPPPTPEPTPSLTKLATSSATYSMNSGSSTASLMGTMTSELTQSLTITTSLEIPPTLSSSQTISKTLTDPIAEIVLEYLGAPQLELAFALASAWVPGLVQCRATSNVSAIPLLLGIDARQIASQKAHLIRDKGVWRQCFESQCFPRGVGGAVVCSDVEVPCSGHADEAVVDALSLARVLARHREEATRSLRMVLFRSLSPFALGTSPLWVLLGSLAATGGAAIVQAGLGTLLFRFIYGKYYSWRSCLAGVHGASIAISWTYTLAGGVGVTLLHIFLNNIRVPKSEDMRFGSGRGVASRTGAWSPTLWQWGGPSYSDSAIKAQCDPLFALCSSLTMRVGIDPRLVDACLPCYDYYAEGRDAEATNDGGFIDDPAVNTFLVESEAFATFALIMSVLVFVIAFPVLSYLAVSWYATPRRYVGLPYEADGRDGMPSVCCCCRPFLFCLRGLWRFQPFSHPTMEQYDQYEAAEERRAKGGRIGSGGVEVEQLSDLEGEDDIDLAGENGAHGDLHNPPKSRSVSPKVYGCWPLYWPFGANSTKFNTRHCFTKPYYVGVQSDSDAELEDELIQLGKSDALHRDYVEAESDSTDGNGAGNALRRVLASLKSGSPFRLSLARGMRRAARRFFRFVACRGFVGPIGIRRLWGPAVSRYRLPSPIWSTMPLWSGLIMELTCLFLSPSMSSALEDIFGYSSSSSELGCSLVLYIAACLHFVLATWLLSGVWKQPLRSPFLNWCTGIAWLITGLHLLMHGVVASDFITHEVDMEAAAEQFAMWEQKVLPSLLADEIVDAVSRNSSSALRGLLSTASLAVPSAGYISKDSVPTEMVTCLAGTVVGDILSGKGAPVYRTAAGALIPMRPPSYYCVQQAVVDKAASMVDDTLRLYLRAVTRDVSNSSAVLTQLARNNAPLYVDNCGVLNCDAEAPAPTGILPSAGDVSFGDLLTTPRGHIWLNTFFLLLFTAVTGVRIASAFFFLISDTFLVDTASGAIKRKRSAQRPSRQQHQQLDENESRAREHTHDNQYSINSVLPSRQPNAASSSCGGPTPATAAEGLLPTELDYYFYFYKDESLLLPCPNDDVSARAMDNEEVFAEMGWAVASGVEKACVAMYDVFRERFGLTSLDEVDDDEGRLEKLAARLNAEREKYLSSSRGDHASSSIDPHRLVRYRVAKVKGLLPPPAQWEVFSTHSSAGASLLAKCLSKICGCCDDRVGSRRSNSSGRSITPTSRARAKSVAYANLLSSGLDESGGTFDFDELLMINKEGDGSSEDDGGERLDSGFRAVRGEAFSQQRKRAASRMYIAMAAAGDDGTISGEGRVRERSRRVTITTARSGELDEPLTRKRGAAVILSKGGVLEASPIRSRQRAEEGTISRKESNEGTDELDEAILRFIVKRDADLKKEEEDDEMSAAYACVAIDGGAGMTQGGLASPLSLPRTRRFTMFSPRDESNAKSVSTYQRVRRKQSVFASADVEELDVDVHHLDVEELEAVAAAEAKRLGYVKVTQNKEQQQQEQEGHESHQSVSSPHAAQQPSTQQVPYVLPPKPKRGSRVRVESASPNSEEREAGHNTEHMKRGEEPSASRPPPPPVARRRVGGVRAGRSMLSEVAESDVNFVGSNHTSPSTAGFGETALGTQQQAPQRPKPKAKSRTKSDFAREVETDDTL